MYCVVRQYKMKPAQDIDNLVGRIRDEFLPLIIREPGYIAYSVALSEQGELITTGFFQSHSGADDSIRLAAEWVRENVSSAIDGPPRVSEGEVVIQERKDGDGRQGALRRIKVLPGKKDETLELMRTKLVPTLTELPGFVRMAVIDVGSDELLSLAAWKDRASAQEATRRAMALMQEAAGKLTAAPPEMIDGEIKLHDANEAALR